MCIDFSDLNAACSKDNLPLPKTYLLVDNAVCYELKSFMDAYNGYNQILMAKEDKEKKNLSLIEEFIAIE